MGGIYRYGICTVLYIGVKKKLFRRVLRVGRWVLVCVDFTYYVFGGYSIFERLTPEN